MNADWFRLWHGAPTDPKWRTIARRASVRPGDVWAVVSVLMDRASQAEDRGSVAGFDAEITADALGFDVDEVQRVVDALADKGVIVNGRLAAWEKYQPKRERPQDVSTERVKAFRERERRETPCNATELTETPREEERRGDREENSTQREVTGLDTPAALSGDERAPRYAFERKTIKLTLKDLRAWEAAYPHISVAGELHALDEWAGKQDNWFPAVSGALAKREREAVIAIEQAKATGMAKGTGPPAYRETRI